MKASADDEEPTGLRVSVIGSNAASSIRQEFPKSCLVGLSLGSHERTRAPGAPGLRTDTVPSTPQTSGMVATSSSGSSWTESFSRLCFRMSGAWSLTWHRWKTSTSRTSSTCESRLASDPAPILSLRARIANLQLPLQSL